MPNGDVTREEYEARHSELVGTIRSLAKTLDALAAKQDKQAQDAAELRGWVKGAVTGVSIMSAVAGALATIGLVIH